MCRHPNCVAGVETAELDSLVEARALHFARLEQMEAERVAAVAAAAAASEAQGGDRDEQV